MENIQAVIEQNAGTIKFNFEEMKQYLNGRLEEYRGAVFTDDSIKSAKVCAAQLRKEQAAFKGRITEVKKEYMRPFEDFKAKADELVKLYDEPICFIDGQIKDFEERRKAEKREEIRKIYKETVPDDIADFLPLEKIYNIRWENATYKKNDIRKEMYDMAVSTAQAVNTIREMKSEACEKALEIYRQILSLSEAVAYINSYERQKAEILLKEQERRRLEEEERIRREEREKIEAEQRAAQERAAAVEKAKEQAAQEVIESLTPEAEGETALYEYRISLTPDAKEKLEMYLDSVGIEWKLVPEADDGWKNI